jgi:hypothetical protein
MSKKISVILFYLSLSISFGILLAFLLDFLLIVQTIKYCLIAFSFTLLFLVIMLEAKTGNTLTKTISIGSNFIGFSIWNLSLFEVFSFDKTWNIAFLFMFFGLISALFFITTKKSSQMMKLLTAFSAFMLLSVIYITGNSVFDNSIILLSSLILFSLFSLISLLTKSK